MGCNTRLLPGHGSRKFYMMTKITDAVSLHIIDLTDEINLFVVRDWVLISALA
ncbi:hypothetical protein MiSe_95280 [Microseira wollei NIES-4236]|uniref:Uncharacterized protein n=1 Tax=Microseira wollei NIES-4236 TaxID=2530354 RepID=A0AAV3XUA7_9CYAN|nr:hypothetical protein MiSe_95280 [Microseira wollei NIES-4236]